MTVTMSMLRFITLLWIACASHAFNLQAQSKPSFTVIKVNGSIYSFAFQRAVVIGDVISSSDKLKFNSRDSYMHVINSTEGLKTVRDVQNDSPRELMDLLRTFMDDKLPRSSRGNAPGIEQVKHEFAYPSILILGEGRMTFKLENMSLKRPSGVKVTYKLNGTKIDKLVSDEMGFNLGKNFISDSEIKSDFPKVQVIYYEELDNWPFAPLEVLGEFVPVFTDERMLLSELKPLIETLKASGASSKEIESKLMLYITGEYEAPVLSNLRDWLAKNELRIE